VLIFFAGWGMDDRPFRALGAGGWDAVCFYDYREMADVPLAGDIAAYPERALAAWSLGCAAANAVAQRQAWSLSRAVAVSGTVVPEDDRLGIPARWMEATAANLAAGGWTKFVRRMCPDAASLAAFAASQPARDLGAAVEELGALRRLTAPDSCVFRVALVSENDRIILPGNQRRCWDRYGVPARPIAAPHYPFHLWKSWEEMLACGG
jgi:biotin synthesis protein BioG